MGRRHINWLKRLPPLQRVAKEGRRCAETAAAVKAETARIVVSVSAPRVVTNTVTGLLVAEGEVAARGMAARGVAGKAQGRV